VGIMAEGNQKLAPTTLVVFGISGDLSRRYLLPALAAICRSSDIGANLEIWGLSRRSLEPGDVLNDTTRGLTDNFRVLQIDYDSAAAYQQLKDELEKSPAQQTIFYFAVPPAAVLPIIEKLGSAGLNDSTYRLLLEKPFGQNYDSAKRLIDQTKRYFKDEQIYRIDHYLAKEMAQNIAVFLGSNAIFRGVWSNKFIERIKIEVSESIGVEGRGGFYEQTGALRDIVQSHLLQLTALILMKPCPDVFDFSQVQIRRLAALKQLSLMASQSTIRGQYDGYKDEVDNPESTTETFVALSVTSSDPDWQGVPIRLVTGKRLDKKLTEIRVHFKKSQATQANILKLRIQPQEGIELELWVKKPGYDQDLQKLSLEFSYQQHFGDLPDAYEQVIVDAIRGRSNLFASDEEVLASWQVLQSVLDGFIKGKPELKAYPPGSSAEELAPRV
ncbi:MAG TPA: glucose-6-phosphate dehydrogenase, partial [Candidatus Saccharimonadales bacterium]|nr:glucose-6-phosphate dehydrogenase [Candidatus Saccharimonadales bacterium]